MQDLVSVLRDSKFVQTGKATQNKFKISVAGTLHPIGPGVPNWNKLTNRFDACSPQASGIDIDRVRSRGLK
jgi:hypothetical protein